MEFLSWLGEQPFENVSMFFLIGLMAIWVLFDMALGLKTVAYVLGSFWILLMMFPLYKRSVKERKKEEVKEDKQDL